MSPLFNNVKRVVVGAVCLSCPVGNNFLASWQGVPGAGVVGHLLARKKKMDGAHQQPIVENNQPLEAVEVQDPPNQINIVNRDAMNVVMEYVGRRDAVAMQLVSKKFYNELVPARIQKLLTELGKLKSQLGYNLTLFYIVILLHFLLSRK